MPYAELKGTDVPEDLRILDLDTILDYLEDNGHYNYIIEIKNDGDLGRRSMDILYADLKERKMLERCIFGCFISEISDYKDEMYPDFIRGPYGAEVVEFYFSALTNRKNYNPKFKTLQLPFNCFPMDRGVNLGTSTVINYAHAHDIAVQYWTVNNETDAAYLMSIGADAIITDYPDMVYRVREN
jgi:glycerophosphoryl diester phosphodiesterase